MKLWFKSSPPTTELAMIEQWRHMQLVTGQSLGITSEHGAGEDGFVSTNVS